MAEAKKATESLNKSERNVKESNDSGIEMSDNKIEKNLTTKCPWVVGQLAWARGSSYPFWPCVVTLDPTTLLYFKVQNKGRSQALMVHVQYFGDGGRHNWVLSHYMIPFSGLEDFKARAKSITPEIKKKDPKFAAAFTQKMGVKKQWGIGVTEASGLMHLTNEDRASIYEPVVPVIEKAIPLANNKLKRKLSPKGSKLPGDTPNSTSKKFKKIENDEESQMSTEQSASNDVATPSRRKSTRNQNKNAKDVETPKSQNLKRKTRKITDEEKMRRDEIDFEDYYNLNKDLWKTDHPDASEEEVKMLLQEVWSEMNAEEKRNNLNRNFDDYRYNSTGVSKAKRVKKNETLHQEKENSKNSENAQVEGNKNTLQLNGKNVEEPVKNGESVKAKLSPQKEKNKEAEKNNRNVPKEKGKISETGDGNVEKESKNTFESVEDKEKSKLNSESVDVQKESKITSESVDAQEVSESVGVQKEKSKITSENGKVEKEKSKISEISDVGIEKEADKINSDTDDDNLQKENDKVGGDLQKKEKDEEESKTENLLQNGKTDDRDKKNSPGKNISKKGKSPIKEKTGGKKSKIIDGKSMKG